MLLNTTNSWIEKVTYHSNVCHYKKNSQIINQNKKQLNLFLLMRKKSFGIFQNNQIKNKETE